MRERLTEAFQHLNFKEPGTIARYPISRAPQIQPGITAEEFSRRCDQMVPGGPIFPANDEFGPKPKPTGMDPEKPAFPSILDPEVIIFER